MTALVHGVHATARFTDGEGNGGGHLGFDEARCHGIDGDALLGVFILERIDHADYRSLGTTVVGLAQVAGNARDGADGDNAGAFTQTAAGEQGFINAQLAGDVDVQHHVPEFFRHVAQHLVAGYPGVVDDHVIAANGFGFCRDGCRCFVSGDIHFQGVTTDLGCYCVQVVGHGRNVQHGDGSAVAGQYFGNGGTNAAGATGNQGFLACQGFVPVKFGSFETGFGNAYYLAGDVSGFW